MTDTCTQHHCLGKHKPCVSLVPIFNHLEREQMDEIMKVVQTGSFKKGELIYQADERADSLYIVNKGKVRIFHLSETGKEQLVRILLPGDFTGELALFQDSDHKGFAEAMVDTQVCYINRKVLHEFLLEYPSIALKIVKEFANRLEIAEKQTTRFVTEKVETRIALFLAECIKSENEIEIELPLTKKDLASYLGTTPETISRNLTKFEQRGLIKRKKNRRIEIIDVDRLLLGESDE